MPLIEGGGAPKRGKKPVGRPTVPNPSASGSGSRRGSTPSRRPTPQPTPMPMPGVAGGYRPAKPPARRPIPTPMYNPIATPRGPVPNRTPQPGSKRPQPLSPNPRSPRGVNKGREDTPVRKKPPHFHPSKPAGGRGGRPVGAGAPVVAGGGSNPQVGATVTGGGANAPKPKAPSPTQTRQDTAAKMQAFIDQARSSVTAEDLPALNQLQRDLDQMTAQYGTQKTEVAERGQRTQSDLAELFGRLGNFTQGIQQQSGQDFNALRGQASNAYANLQGAVGRTFDGAEANTNAELARLGLQGQAPNATADMQRDENFLKGLAGVDGTNLVSGLAMQQQGFDNLMGMARNNAATEGSVRVGQAGRDTNRTLAELMQQFNENQSDITGKRSDIVATQGQRARELAMALEDKDYARRVEAAQTQFNNMLATERLGMDKKQFEAGMQPQTASYADELDLAMKKIELDNMIAEQDKARFQGNGPVYRTDSRGRRIITGTGATFGPKFVPDRRR